MSAPLYEETQRARENPWIQALLAVMLLALLFTVFGTEEQPGSALGSLVLVGLGALAAVSRLTVKVYDDRITMDWYPILSRTIETEQIERVTVCSYRPLRDWGGWGIRFRRSRGTAYTMSGDQGVELALAPGGRVLLGSRTPDLLAAAVRHAIRTRRIA